MKKAGIILIVGLLLMVMAGTAIAQSNTPEAPLPKFDGQDQETLQKMYDYCHGPNGVMNKYYDDGNNEAAPQGFAGMMGGNGPMMGL